MLDVALGRDSARKLVIADAAVAGSKCAGNCTELGHTQIDWKPTDEVYKGWFVYSAFSETVVRFEECPIIEFTVDKGFDQAPLRGIDVN
jgi:hypothetical protein